LGHLTPHRHAMILSLGLGITATLSFIAPIIAPGSNVKLNTSIMMFGIVHSFIWFVLTYILARLILNLCMKK